MFFQRLYLSETVALGFREGVFGRVLGNSRRSLRLEFAGFRGKGDVTLLSIGYWGRGMTGQFGLPDAFFLDLHPITLTLILLLNHSSVNVIEVALNGSDRSEAGMPQGSTLRLL